MYFVERRNLKNIRKELRETINILKNGLHLIFFPEGTSTDGSKMLPFHPLFFTTAIQAKKSVLPVCVNYTKVEDECFGLKNRDLICWYDRDGRKVSFTNHLFRLLQLKSIEVTIQFLPPINSANKNSRSLAEESYSLIKEKKISLQ